MNYPLKKFVIVIVIVIVMIAMYFGSYLPFRKGQLLIEVIQNAKLARTVDEFEKTISQSLDFYSPTGQNESVRQIGNIVLNVLASQNDLPKPIAEELLDFTAKYFEPIIQVKRGGNLSQNFLILGYLYQTVGLRFNESSYMEKAIDYYKEGLKISPKRPQFLYNLLEIYQAQKDSASAKGIAEKILEYWPNDEKIREKLENL